MLWWPRVYQHVWFRLIICKESRAVLQKIFQHNVCNNNDFTVHTAIETCVQCCCHSDPRHTTNDVSIIRFCDQWSAVAVHATPARYLACFIWSMWRRRWCRSPKWRNPPDLNPGCWGACYDAQWRRHAQSRRRYAKVFRVMCYGAPSCYRVHSWHPLASYAFIKIKLASCHLLLYVVYIMCQKSLNFIDAFSCHKQKWKLTTLNLGHPVDGGCSFVYFPGRLIPVLLTHMQM